MKPIVGNVLAFTSVFKNKINKSNKHAYVAAFPALFAGVEPLKLNIDMFSKLYFHKFKIQTNI